MSPATSLVMPIAAAKRRSRTDTPSSPQRARSSGTPTPRRCPGWRALETIQLAAPHLDAEAEVAAFVPEDGPEAGTLGPVAGAARLLQRLPVGSWAVATSGPRDSAIARLRSAGLPLPSVLICAEDV